MFTQDQIDVFWQALRITVQGMTGIFIFMFVFFMIIKLIDKVFPKKEQAE